MEGLKERIPVLDHAFDGLSQIEHHACLSLCLLKYRVEICDKFNEEIFLRWGSGTYEQRIPVLVRPHRHEMLRARMAALSRNMNPDGLFRKKYICFPKRGNHRPRF